MTDLSTLTAEELEAQLHRMQAARQEILDAQDEVRQELSRRLTLERAELAVAGMSPEQVDAIVAAATARAGSSAAEGGRTPSR